MHRDSVNHKSSHLRWSCENTEQNVSLIPLIRVRQKLHYCAGFLTIVLHFFSYIEMYALLNVCHPNAHFSKWTTRTFIMMNAVGGHIHVLLLQFCAVDQWLRSQGSCTVNTVGCILDTSKCCSFEANEKVSQLLVNRWKFDRWYPAVSASFNEIQGICIYMKNSRWFLQYT